MRLAYQYFGMSGEMKFVYQDISLCMSGHDEFDMEIMYIGMSSQMKKSNSDTCM